jgi:nucleobase:cation symporter-1, NCS1 family
MVDSSTYAEDRSSALSLVSRISTRGVKPLANRPTRSCLGFAICPWLIQAKAQRFLAFLNGYTVFLGPLIGLLLSDYWLVRKGKGFNVRNLYRPGNSLYWYVGGFNPRAIAALLVGIAPLLPGLAHSINPSLAVSRGAQAYYTMSWLVGLAVTLITYYVLYLVSPWTTNPSDVLEGEDDPEIAGSDTITEEAESKPKDM